MDKVLAALASLVSKGKLDAKDMGEMAALLRQLNEGREMIEAFLPMVETLITENKDLVCKVLAILADTLVEIQNGLKPQMEAFARLKATKIKMKIEIYMEVAGLSREEAFAVVLAEETKPNPYSTLISNSRTERKK